MLVFRPPAALVHVVCLRACALAQQTKTEGCEFLSVNDSRELYWLFIEILSRVSLADLLTKPTTVLPQHDVGFQMKNEL